MPSDTQDTPDAPPPAKPASPPATGSASRRAAWWTRGLLAIIALMTVSGLWAFRQWHRTPDYWQHNQQWLQHDNATLLTSAQDLERLVLAALSARGDQPDAADGQVHLTFEQINAWLALRLADWCAHQRIALPAEVKDFMLASEAGHLVLSFRYQTKEIDQVASVLFDLQIGADGKARLVTHGLRAGMLPVPVTAMTRHFQNKNHISAAALRQAINALEGQSFDPVIAHPGHASRVLRLVRLQPTGDGVQAVVRTERRPSPTPAARAGAGAHS